MNITISAVKTEELSICLDVIRQSFRTVAEHFGLTRENCPKHTSFMQLYFLETQKKWGWKMYALYDGETMIGYMSLSKEDDGVYELHNLAVLPAYRHKGLGKRLLDYAKDVVKTSGGHVIKVGMIEESTVFPKLIRLVVSATVKAVDPKACAFTELTKVYICSVVIYFTPF